jgi:aminoglycoside phosphotransferase (APT) family kinase protein
MTERRPTPKLHADEVGIDEALVRELLRSQFPAWADLPLRRVSSTGTDNAIYRLGHEMGIRLPRIHWAVDQIGKEYRCLPRLSAHVPVALPLPLAEGRGQWGYPYPWLIYRWLEGEDLQHADVHDFNRLAGDLAQFVMALGHVDAMDGPSAGPRGGSLTPHDEMVRATIRLLDDSIDTDRALAVWREALDADQSSGSLIWVHGDLLPGNILIRRSRLSGVIDWGAAGLGDQACDAMVGWFLPPESRAVFREDLGYDDATWARARGWVVQQTSMFILYYSDSLLDAVVAAKQRLQAALGDPLG